MIHQVHAFTQSDKEGNAAGVVPQAEGLSERQMQQIANRMNLSETAFVLPPTTGQAAFRLRWFTPTTEVPLCGHATVATLFVLSREGRIPADGTVLRIETLSGTLDARVDGSTGNRRHWLQVPVPDFKIAAVPGAELDSLYGVTGADLHRSLPVVEAQGFSYFPVSGLDVLRAIRPDYPAITRSRALGTACFFTEETLDAGSKWHTRFFAPKLGINEDPVTGAINGPLGAYHFLFADRLASGDVAYVGEQGDLINRKGRVFVNVSGKGAGVARIEIGGHAALAGSHPLKQFLGNAG